MKSTLYASAILLLNTVSLSGHAFQIRSDRRVGVGRRNNADAAGIIARRPYPSREPSSSASGAVASMVVESSRTKIMSAKENYNYDDDATRSILSPAAATAIENSLPTDDNDHQHHHLIRTQGGEESRRRSFLKMFSIASIFPFVYSSNFLRIASASAAADIKSTSTNSAIDSEENIRRLLLKLVTDKVYMDVRISRADGTFYVRDNTDGTDEDPFYGRLVIGLFGKRTPNHVEQFMKYITNGESYDINNPLPSYSTSKFPLLDNSSGLLIGGKIPGLEPTTLAGGTALEYAGRVLPAKLWIEDRKGEMPPNVDSAGSIPQLSHSIVGLLTHRNLDLTPSFGITTRRGSSPSTSELDATHTIFGCILEDTNGFLEKVVDLPVLTDTGMVSMTTTSMTGNTYDPASSSKGGSSSSAGVVDMGVSSLASSVFTVQRKVFRDAAKTFGDTRLDKVYDGKLLRRIEVTKVGVL